MPPANTLIRWVNENAFASIVQARPVPPLADQFIVGVAPIDYGPVLLLMPFGFHLAMDTLPSEKYYGGFRSALAVSGFRLRARLGFAMVEFPSRRGITPVFGYAAPHPSGGGT